MVDIVWEEPPDADKGRRGPDRELTAFFEALRERPGTWARWPRETTRHTVANVNRGRYPMAPKGEFEALSRGGVVYVRALACERNDGDDSGRPAGGTDVE